MLEHPGDGGPARVTAPRRFSSVYAGDHEPPHFHVRYGDHKAVIRLTDGALTAGTLPRRAQQLAAEWYTRHADERAVAWDKAKAGEHPGTIAPLD